MKTVGIVGKGFVGNATAKVWMEHADVKCFDIDKTRCTHPLGEVMQCDFVYMCLPTPAGELGECNLKAYEDVFNAATEKALREARMIIKSTVPIGFTQKLADRGFHVVHSPEFLTARCAIADAHTPSRNIVGYPTGAFANRCYPIAIELQKAYEKRFPGVQCFVMRSCESEAVKLMANNFFATKVAFFNEWYSWAQANDITWDVLLEAFLADGRIAHAHTKVPGPDGRRGFGGTCLPKDLANTIDSMKQIGFESHILKAVQDRNLKDRGDRL